MGLDPQPLHVSVIAIPDAVISTLGGIYDILSAFTLLAGHDDVLPPAPPFAVEIVGQARGAIDLASGLPIQTHRGIGEIARTDIVIVPSMWVGSEGWQTGRYPGLVAWLQAMHARGAWLCSACSGVFLLAETGIFDGREATIHWGYAAVFQRTFPRVVLRPEQVLVVAGRRDELVSSGASNTWHDLVLYLIARRVGPAAAQSVAKFFALQWHRDGMAPYMRFEVPTDHGDAVIASAQTWLTGHVSVASPVEEMVRRSGLAERSFKRRFSAATGYSPIAYVQRLRVEQAKQRLERTDEPVEQISWRVGYEDASYFRRLFRRITGLSPGGYRRKFHVPTIGVGPKPGRTKDGG